MEKETLKNILDFIEANEGRDVPQKWKLIEILETYPDGTKYKHNDDLVLTNSMITKLPNDLYVNGYLMVNRCKQLKELPNNLHVERVFACNKTSIEELPNNLYVGSDLHIQNTQIKEIPNNLYVGGDFFINNTPLADKYTDDEIRKMITSTGGEVREKIRS
jgi:hypothetical protein